MKKIKYLIMLFCLFIIGFDKINAFSINASSTVYVNSTVAVTVEASGLIGRFDISSSNSSVLAGADSKWIENGSVTVYFTARSVGSSTITVRAVDVSDTNGNDYTGSRSVTINVINKPTNPDSHINVNPSYSKNNYLKNLSIEGYTLSPNFSKDVLEYKIELKPGTEKIKISAEAEDNNANVKGTGEVNVSEGINTLNVIVAAENGNERTYKIIATVKEKDPINVKINGKEYRVVKKKEVLGSKDGYTQKNIKINNIDVPVLYNEITDLTLVGLKDEKGNIVLYSYDSKTGEYKEYKEFKFDLMNLYIHEDKKNSYKKINIKLNNSDVVAYELEGIEDYCLIYATNTATGYEGYYLYDKIENSVQRYDTKLLDRLTKEKDKYLSLVLVLSTVCFLTMIFMLIMINKSNIKKENGE